MTLKSKSIEKPGLYINRISNDITSNDLRKCLPKNFHKNFDNTQGTLHQALSRHLNEKIPTLDPDIHVDSKTYLIFDGPGNQEKKLCFIVIMDISCQYNQKKETVFASILHCFSAPEVTDLVKTKFGVFLSHILKDNKSKSLFISDPFAQHTWLKSYSWLEKDRKKYGKRHWHKVVGDDSGMFYNDNVSHYIVADEFETGDTGGMWVFSLSVEHVTRVQKEGKEFMLYDKVMKWVRVTDYLEKDFRLAETINKLKGPNDKKKSIFLGRNMGSGAQVHADREENGDLALEIPSQFRNTSGNFCVWLSTALLVRTTAPQVAELMLKLKEEHPSKFEEIVTFGKCGNNKLTAGLNSVRGVSCLRYKKDKVDMNVFMKVSGSLPALLSKKQHLLIVCGLISNVGNTGHCIGVDLWNRLIWDPNQFFAKELTVENLNHCCELVSPSDKDIICSRIKMPGVIRLHKTNEH